MKKSRLLKQHPSIGLDIKEVVNILLKALKFKMPAVFTVIKEQMAIRSNLLENVAKRITKTLLDEFPAVTLPFAANG